jgi:hypothetical protein
MSYSTNVRDRTLVVRDHIQSKAGGSGGVAITLSGSKGQYPLDEVLGVPRCHTGREVGKGTVFSVTNR